MPPEARSSSENAGLLREAEALRRAGKLNAARRLLEERGSGAGLGARILLARLLAQGGELDAARALYAEVLAADPQNLPALRALATAGMAAGRWEEAAGYLDRWAAADPDDPELEDLREELALARQDGPAEPAALPGGEQLEDILTRPDEARAPSALLLEGELLPAPSLADAEAWDLGDDWEDPPSSEGS